MQRHGHEQVELERPAVERGQDAAGAVDLARAELGHELDLLLVEQEGQVLGKVGLVNALSSGVE